MLEVSAHRILEVWEQGVSVTLESRTQALLSLVEPELPKEVLAEQVLGERNKNLLDLHQQLFGSTLEAYVECNKCGQALDLEFGLDQFGFDSITHLPDTHSILIGNITAQVRLPNSHDLVALESLKSVEDGRNLLFSRCVLELRRGDSILDLDELAEDEIEQLEEGISGLDPRMEVLFNLQCPQCAHTWQSPLDIGSFLWSEYDTYARQLLEAVHTLASHYGWTETDILTMSQHRRHYYLQRIIQ